MNKYTDLPDYLTPEEMNGYLEEFLAEHGHETCLRKQTLDELWELSFRQYHTYEMVNEQMGKRMETFLLQIMDLEDPHNAGTLLGITLTFGFVSVFQHICREKDKLENREAKEMLDYCIALDGQHPEDPYWDLKKK